MAIRTPDQRLRVFVSSTLQELAEERASTREAIARLRLTPVMFELSARAHPPKELYRAYLEQSQVFIGIYWERYGWIAPDMNISGLEDEYILSGNRPKLIYIKTPAPNREPRLKDMLERIRQDNTVSYRPFGSAKELQQLIENDLAILLTEQFELSAPKGGAGGAPGPFNNLPAPTIALIGREHDIEEIGEVAVHGPSRLVTLSGPGGIGKTRLAIEVARLLAPQFEHGVGLVELASLGDPGLVPAAIASALGVREEQGRPLIRSLLDHLQGKHFLLILDNCEHLIRACAEAAEAILTASPGTRILATSREPLAITGERVWPVSALQVPDPGQPLGPERLEQYSAVQLFVERAALVRPGFHVTTGNASAIVQICHRLDGIPLAIELAAARARSLPVEEIARRLDDRFHLLTSGSRTALPRHQTLRALIDWSYALLSDAERVTLRRLAVFAGSWTIEAMERVCSDGDLPAELALDAMLHLVERSLIALDEREQEPRYRMLETIRQYAQEKLAASAEWVMSHDQYLACYLRLTEEVAPKLHEQYQQLWLNWLETENDNIRAALAWAAEHGHVEEGLRIGIALFTFWQMRAYAREGRSWFERLLTQADDKVPLEVRVNGLAWLSVLAAIAGDMKASTAYGEEAMALCEAAGEDGKLALKVALIGAATAARSAGDYETTYALGRRITELYRELGNTTSVGTGTMVEGETAVVLGKYDEAHALLEESLTIARAATDTVLMGLALKALGDLACCEGRFAQAGVHFEESLLHLREVGAVHEIAVAQHGLAYVCLHQGNVERAQSLFRESLEAMRAQEDRDGVMKGLLGFAALVSATGLASDSARLYAAAAASGAEKSATRWPPEKIEYEHYLAQARANLSEAAFEAEQANGRALSIEQAIEQALNLSFPLAVRAGRTRAAAQTH